MGQAILFLKNEKDQLEIKICAIPDWEGFDKLIDFLHKEYRASTLHEYDGPDARRWILECDGFKFELIHDDMFGNYLVSPTKESDAIVLEIARDLEQRLSNFNIND